LVQDEDVIT
jgi:hypothetical protein